jgi:hypothetical protein
MLAKIGHELRLELQRSPEFQDWSTIPEGPGEIPVFVLIVFLTKLRILNRSQNLLNLDLFEQYY